GDRRSPIALIVATHFESGAMRELITLLADEFRSRGIDVAVAALHRGRGADLSYGHCEVMVEREKLAALDYLRAFFRLVLDARQYGPFAILAFLPAANFLATLCGSLVGIPIRIATHQERSSNHSPLLRAIDRVFGSLGIYSHIVAASEAIRRSLPSHP